MQRIKRWVIEVMKFIGTLPKTTVVFSISKQLADSSGSTGANFVEARAARSRPEFTSSMGIAAKECKESLFWLTILLEMGLGEGAKINYLLKEGNEIASVLISICQKVKLKNREK